LQKFATKDKTKNIVDEMKGGGGGGGVKQNPTI
jgi:hypothetical protein